MKHSVVFFPFIVMFVFEINCEFKFYGDLCVFINAFWVYSSVVYNCSSA